MLDHLSADSYVEQLLAAHNAISRHVPLSVTPEATVDFAALWHLCQALRNKEVAAMVCNDERLAQAKPEILAMYAEWSYLREVEAAEHILAADNTVEAFHAHFKDLPLYERIVGLEYQSVRTCAGRELKNALMIGSGPVGSTAMILRRLGLSVDCVDISSEANAISAELMRRMDVTDGITHITSDVLHLTDLAKYDVIWLAGFVGVGDLKQRVIAHLAEHAAPGAFIIVRSASIPCTILYTEVQPWELDAFERYIYLQPLSFNNHSAYIVRQYGEYPGHG